MRSLNGFRPKWIWFMPHNTELLTGHPHIHIIVYNNYTVTDLSISTVWVVLLSEWAVWKVDPQSQSELSTCILAFIANADKCWLMLLLAACASHAHCHHQSAGRLELSACGQGIYIQPPHKASIQGLCTPMCIHLLPEKFHQPMHDIVHLNSTRVK